MCIHSFYVNLNFLQPHDEHHTERHSLHSADDEHGQVLERPARHLCHTQAGRGAHQIGSVQETTTYS